MSTPPTDGQAPAPRVLVVDDNPYTRAGLVSLLEAGGEVVVAGEAGDGRQAIDMVAEVDADLVLLDVRMPGVDGLEAVGALAEHCKVVMLTSCEEPEAVRTALRRGASGYLVYDTFTVEELAGHIRAAVAGSTSLSPPAAAAVLTSMREDPPPQGAGGAAGAPSGPPSGPAPSQDTHGLSAREAEVMDLIARGKPNAGIAADLFLSEKTVKNHVNRIYAKLGVSSRAEAMARWIGTADVLSGGLS